jgi:hypothetical protein
MNVARPLRLLMIVAITLPGWCAVVRAEPSTQPATTKPSARVMLDVVTEEGQKQLRATVLAGDKPVENATVSFGVKRTFGTLTIGEDKTLDDGTAVVRFPADLPGGREGVLAVVAHATLPGASAPVHGEASFDGARKVAVSDEPLPRALWAPHAPVALILPIVALLAAVWSTYAFAISQIVAIRKGAKR